MPNNTENCCAAKVAVWLGGFTVGDGSNADVTYKACVADPTAWGCGLPGFDTGSGSTTTPPATGSATTPAPPAPYDPGPCIAAMQAKIATYGLTHTGAEVVTYGAKLLQDCLNNTNTSGGNNPATPPSTCPECGVGNIGACIACGAEYLVKGAEFLAANVAFGLLVLLGLYLLFRPQIDAGAQRVVAAGKRAGEVAAV